MMTRVFDCFTFFNELDLLEIRLNELSHVVDFFVIAESTATYQGGPKPLYFQENAQRFAAYKDRIRHIVVDRMPVGAQEKDNWLREFHQRNALTSGLDDALPEDAILLSDADEIPRAASVFSAIESFEAVPAVHCFELAMYTYFVNYLHKEPWARSGPRLTRWRHLRSMQALREVRPPTANPFQSALRWVSACANMGRLIRRVVHTNAGWHFSSMGGADKVTEKFGAFAHIIPERRRNPGGSVAEMAAERIHRARTDSDFRKVPLDDSFPAYLVANQSRYRHLLAFDDI